MFIHLIKLNRHFNPTKIQSKPFWIQHRKTIITIMPNASSSTSKNVLPISETPNNNNPIFKIPSLKSQDISNSATRIVIPSIYEDNNGIEATPFIPRTRSYTSAANLASNNHQQRRRRVASDGNLSDGARLTFRRGMGTAASDTYLITRLSLSLLSYLGIGYRWVIRFVSLGFYAFLLFPGFIQVGYYYFFSSQIRRSVVYGDQPRNRLDLYLPKNTDVPKPVVAFVTGGAWIIGYKAWGSLLGQQLAERDVIVACIDYRNFPQGTMGDMVKDAAQGISFVCNNIAGFGGDPNRVYLMGQSAGAHIGACTLVEQAAKEARGEKTTWSVSQIKSYFGLSGGYNLFNLVDHFHSRGLYRSIFLSIMEGEESLRRFSPEVLVQDQDPSTRKAVSLLPPIILFHGTADYSIPSDASKSFAETLRSVGVQSESHLYEGKTHTDLFLQDPMRGGRDDLFEDVVSLIHAGDEEALAKDVTAPPRRRLVPEFMLKLAHKHAGHRCLASIYRNSANLAPYDAKGYGRKLVRSGIYHSMFEPFVEPSENEKGRVVSKAAAQRLDKLLLANREKRVPNDSNNLIIMKKDKENALFVDSLILTDFFHGPEFNYCAPVFILGDGDDMYMRVESRSVEQILPHETYVYFMDLLAKTVRDEIAGWS